jgi:hypothetical protein
MSQPDSDSIAQAQEYIRSKQLPKAQRLLVEYIKKNPNSEQAWYVLSTAVDDPRKQIECLQRVLRINPANAEAQTRLMQVMAAQAAPTAAEQSAASEPPPDLPIQPVEPEPIEPEPPAKPLEPAMVIDTELSSLRSKAKFVKPRKPRKRWPRIVILLLLIMLALIVSGYLLLNSFNQAANPFAGPATVEIVMTVPIATPAPTETPTVTPTPSITPTRYPPTWTPTPAPTKPPTRTPTPLPTLNPAVQTGLQRLRDQVAAQRGLDTGVDVPSALLPRERVESTLRTILDIQRRQPELVSQARALAALGLVRPGFDLSRYTINRFADNAGGFAIPWQNVIEVAGEEFGGVEGIVYAHQAAHALLDKRFDSARWGLYPACVRGDDQCHTLQALIEGDAALITDRWLEKDATKLNKEALPKYQALPPAISDPSAPPFIMRDVAFRSEQGRKFVEALYRSGGWAAVNKAYEELPAGTEHILHPEKFVAGEQPAEVAVPPLSGVFGNGWQLIADEVLGEWRTYLLLGASVDEAARLSDETAQAAAAGWGGDHYRVYYDPQNDQSALVAEWRWDTPQDAAEFQQALSTYLDLRFRGAKSQAADQNCWATNRQTTCLYSTENGTLWVLAPEFSLVDQIRQAYSAFQ